MLIGAVLLVSAAAETFRAFAGRKADLNAALVQLQDETGRIAERQAELIRSTEDLVEFLIAGSGDMRTFARNRECAQTLLKFVEQRPEIDNIVIALPDGDIVCNARSQTRINLSDRTFFQKSLTQPIIVVGEPLLARGTGSWILPFARTVRDKEFAPQAVVIVSMDLAWIAKEFGVSSTYFQNARLGVVDTRGVVLSHYPDPERMVGRNVADTPFFQNIVSKGGRGTGEEPGLDGAPRVYAVTHLTETATGPLYVWTAFYKNEVTGKADHQFLLNIGFAGLLCLGSFLALWFAGERYFIRPLSAITRAAQQLSTGDYQARTGLTQKHGELGQLAAAFDNMALAMASKSEILRLNRALKVLSRCGDTLVKAKTEEDLLVGICRTTVESGNYRTAWIGFAENDPDKSVRPVASFGEDNGYLAEARISWSADAPSGRGPVGTAIRTGQTQASQDISVDQTLAPWRDTLIEHKYRSVVALPLKDHDRVFGIFIIYAGETDAFNPEEIRLLEQLADDIAFGILAHRSKAERERAEEQALRLSKTDALTGLPNRVELIAHLQRSIKHAQAIGGQVAVVQVSVDRLIDIQDGIGLAGADDILRQMAERLSAVTGQVHFVARNGGASFSVIVPAVVEDSAAIERDLKIVTEQPFEYAGIPIDIEATIGVAIFPEHGDDADTLLRHADIAVRQARSSGRFYSVYSGKVDSESPDHLILLSDLRKAIRDDHLTLFYQPKVSPSTHTVAGAEALVRWNHPTRGFVPPGKFVPLAERTGLIKSLTDSVMGTAMRQIAEWQRMGTNIHVAVNVSPNNLRDPDFLDQLISMLDKHEVKLDLLDIELTETALMEDPRKSLDVLSKITQLGGHIFIDDFGTGYSSLAYLARLPIHALNLDRSFIIRMNEPRYEAIVSSTISLAHSLGIKVVAEGVETEALVQQLMTHGCDEIQGYFYCKPLPADDFLAWRNSFQKPELVAL
jgi:diguanylate cyclase (GGDEF)-like protein